MPRAMATLREDRIEGPVWVSGAVPSAFRFGFW